MRLVKTGAVNVTLYIGVLLNLYWYFHIYLPI